MFKNYLKIAVRNLLRYKAYSYINICGLAIGIACCLLILLYIFDELSYDKYHLKADRIYRINTDMKLGAWAVAAPLTSDMIGPTLKKDYPEVEDYTRIYSFVDIQLVKKGNEYNNEEKIAYVDSSFFKLFTYPVISGTTDKAFTEPNTVVITESIAKKYFGTVNAAGKFIEIKQYGSQPLYKIIAVIQDMPANSHFRFNFLFPMMNLNYSTWGNHVAANFYTYLLFKEGTNLSGGQAGPPTGQAGYKGFKKNLTQYEDKYVFPFIKQFMKIGSKEEFIKAGNKIEFSLIPLRDIHLYSNRNFELSPGGTIKYVYIFSAVALFILIIACINFMNLTTARSSNRAKEVGIRKMLGTERKNLIIQFLSESIMMSLISVCLAVIIVYNVLPLFNNFAGKEISTKSFGSPAVMLFLFSLPFIIGLLAGSYPAFFLSRFKPGEIIKGKLSLGSKSGAVRSTLVVFQFASSIILITATIIIYMQLNFIQNKNPGYQKDQVLIINNSYYLGNNTEAFKNDMLKVPGVIKGTISGYLPVSSYRSNNPFVKEPSMSSYSLAMQNWQVDYDYIPTMGMQIIKGRNFSAEFGTDSSAIILNEKAVKQLGYINPVGEKIYKFGQGGKLIGYNIIGVVKDFNFESLHQDIGALCFELAANWGFTSFRINAKNTAGILKEAETKWKTMAPGMPFSYRFMDDSFNEMYRTEQRIGIIALSFSVIAIFVACLGLFGLAAFLAEQKTKEIGIRKVLGASIPSIFLMLSKEFVKWVAIANIIAWPLAFYFLNKWLQDFAYRINISWWMFAAAGCAALFIALFTVSFQAIKAATANPVESLKYE